VKDQESLNSNSAAAYLCSVGAYLLKPAELQLKHHQATAGDPPTHLNAQAQLQRKLNSIDNEEQYPGARFAMGDEGIYMYQQSASSAVELMNAANK
jgi:hypothetical protein